MHDILILVIKFKMEICMKRLMLLALIIGSAQASDFSDWGSGAYSLINKINRVLKPLKNVRNPRAEINNDLNHHKNLIVEALQSEIAFTNSTDSKPIIATYGCGPCVAFGAYDETNKFAVIAHFATPDEIKENYGNIMYKMSLLAKNPIKKPIQVHLRGGHAGVSEETIEAIKKLMKLNKNFPMEIASQNILHYSDAQSLLIDSRTGEVQDYDPMKNPFHREITQVDIQRMLLSAYYPNLRTAYFPSNINKTIK